MKSNVHVGKRDGERDGDYIYRSSVADAAVVWFKTHLRHVEGPAAGQPFVLEQWQADYIRCLFGWRFAPMESVRRYRRALLEVPRGNGKSMLASGLAILGLRPFTAGATPRIIGAATDRAAAGIVFGYAARMVRANQKLKTRLRLLDSTKWIHRIDGAGSYNVISSEAPRAYGYHPNLVIFDELHTQPDRELFDVLATSQITLSDALMLSITTAGFDRTSICWQVHSDALRACEMPDKYPDFLAAVYQAEDNDDIEDPAVWRKANPNFGVSILERNMRETIAEARRDPATLNRVLREHFNIWTNASSRWMNMREWDACGEPFDPAMLKGRFCYGGLDLAQVDDLAAFALVFPDDTGPYHILIRAYAPEETIRQRAHYQEFVRMGLLTPTPGKATDFGFIRHDVIAAAAMYDLRAVGFDRMYAGQLSQELAAENITVEPVGQGYFSLTEPTKEIMRLVLSRRVRHGGNALLRWNAANMVVTQDPAGNIKPDKAHSGDKIDGMAAVITAMSVALKSEQQGLPEIRMIG